MGAQFCSPGGDVVCGTKKTKKETTPAVAVKVWRDLEGLKRNAYAVQI